MALHPDRCFCEACQEPDFCDQAYPDFERKFATSAVANHGFQTEVDASEFGSLKGVSIASLTQFPTPTDPEILSMDLPSGPKNYFLHTQDAPRSYFTQASEAELSWDGIAPTQSANSQSQIQEVPKLNKKLLMYGLLAYLLLKK